jgi:hypothetical protein
MLNTALEDVQCLKALSTTLDFYFEEMIEAKPTVNIPVRTQQQGVWIHHDGDSRRKPVGFVYSLSDTLFTYTWDDGHGNMRYDTARVLLSPSDQLKLSVIKGASFPESSLGALGRSLSVDEQESLRLIADGPDSHGLNLKTADCG